MPDPKEPQLEVPPPPPAVAEGEVAKFETKIEHSNVAATAQGSHSSAQGMMQVGGVTVHGTAIFAGATAPGAPAGMSGTSNPTPSYPDVKAQVLTEKLMAAQTRKQRLQQHSEDTSPDRFAILVAATNTLGYLLAVVPPIYVDPKLTTRDPYGGRSYPDAWLYVVPVAAGVLCVTWLVSSRPSKSHWWSLAPLFAAVLGSFWILKPGGRTSGPIEFPHARLVTCPFFWLLTTAAWIVARYHANRRIVRERNRITSFAVLLCLGRLVVLFSLAPAIVTDHGEQQVLWIDAYITVALEAAFWLAMPLRELYWGRMSGQVGRR